eukprot:2587460-Prymnesium_polylepis.1
MPRRRQYKDIANDPSGSVALAHRFLGLNSSEEAVVIMIIVSFIMLISFVCTLFAQTYFHARQLRLEAKWSVCTLEPPTVRWELDGIYAAFLSHYKVQHRRTPVAGGITGPRLMLWLLAPPKAVPRSA